MFLFIKVFYFMQNMCCLIGIKQIPAFFLHVIGIFFYSQSDRVEEEEEERRESSSQAQEPSVRWEPSVGRLSSVAQQSSVARQSSVAWELSVARHSSSGATFISSVAWQPSVAWNSSVARHLSCDCQEFIKMSVLTAWLREIPYFLWFL